MFFTQQLLRNHSFSCEAQALPELKSHQPGQVHVRGKDLPYQLVQVGERFYYFYPPANTILGVPYVAVANLLGISAIDKNGVYDARGDLQIQKGLAALLMAGLCVVIFFTSRLLLPLGWSLTITAAAAFGTQIWSTASRLVWSHTWGIFLLGIAVWLIVRAETKQKRIPPVVLASCLAWLYFVRPTFSVSIVAITVYLLLYHGRILLPFAVTGVLWLGALVAFSEYHYGQLLPPYYHSYVANNAAALASFREGLAGTLISPSRGLFVYLPVLLFVAYLLVRYHKTSQSRLVFLALSVVTAHVVLVSRFQGWHGGYSYGPRLCTDVVPWLALLGMLAVHSRLKYQAANPGRDSGLLLWSECGVGLALLAVGIMLNGIGAVWGPASRWNIVPTHVNEDTKRLWDWRHPPFLGPPDSTATDNNSR